MSEQFITCCKQPTPSVEGIDYSLTEQDTGIHWLDGRRVYQLTFQGTLKGANVPTDFPLPADFDMLLELDGCAYNHAFIIPIPTIGESSGGATAGLPYSVVTSVQRGANVLRVRNYSDRNGWTVFMTMKYVKK